MNNAVLRSHNKPSLSIVNYPLTITMEPEVGAFLARIAKSISLILLWMLINTFFGVRKGLFFLDEKLTVGHVVFYTWFIGSGIFLFWFIIKIWKAAPVYDPREDAWSYKQKDNEPRADNE